ncbi:MAG: ligase-associated DNA damage response endonuclease PdeM [Chitinophagaceae bacterium]|nr:ligase-associated DNA damage response endonuclease PdeM [Chitinophagaceae bacterium]
MAAYLSHIVGEEHLVVSAERTLFWENESTLIVADLHAGKTGHFRKAGIGIPQQVYKDDLHRLLTQILFFKAERLIIVGDLTHSLINKEMDLFRKWRKDFSTLDVHLVKGNHDILEDTWYSEADITVSHKELLLKKFLFVHDVETDNITAAKGQYIFSGHLHPGIIIRGKGRQSLRFPCFYFTKNFCVLPAFSRFTGTYLVEPGKDEHAFAVIEKDIVPINR